MLKNSLVFLILLIFLTSCGDKKQEQHSINQNITPHYQKLIKESILKSLKEPEYYQEISWEKMRCSDTITRRIHKNAEFIEHSFQSKNIFKGMITKTYIYFIGDSNPSLIIDFDMKTAFEEFLANQNIGALLMPYIFNFETLLIALKQSTTDAHAKQRIHDFIYAISKIRKQELDELADAISTLNTPMSRANNYAIFLVL
ncbi:MAG: hypothetical protein PHR87_10675, partial [Sulfurospirillaceae bacterium]|nr:hypothetical protein [Sulfurospirillaceae bacterium]